MCNQPVWKTSTGGGPEIRKAGKEPGNGTSQKLPIKARKGLVPIQDFMTERHKTGQWYFFVL